MTSKSQTLYSSEQTLAWLRGLYTLALADGQFDEEEQQLIDSFIHGELATTANLASLEPISPKELGRILAPDPKLAENFLRTAVMVALADGIYSVCEDDLLHQFCQALKLKVVALDTLRRALQDLSNLQTGAPSKLVSPPVNFHEHHPIDVLAPVKYWLDGLEIHDPNVAHTLCKLIPPQCPFERDIMIFGRKIVHIPPMCKLNPLYEQFVGLRFRALCYLADQCHEDIAKYC